ncbi:hypothetical protein SDC9_46167 [bioreactor metagenome]|uniref:Uncharacterized protein n=1 Tax=bioreactor metagenome TaxID=1076179 RepID=A0A644W825_9ZZZZ|nr:hypothetical protein [Methanobrevibacter sp.]MEA4957829.1 hypothetical protein [Methanobrevibacter sp.]
MMNKKRILILIFVLTIAVVFTIASVSSASAATKTVNFKNSGTKNVKIGHGDYIGLYYSTYGSQYPPRTLEISLWSSNYYPKYYKMTKAKVYFKKSNGQTVYKVYKGSYVTKKVHKGWKPKKAIIYYKKK